LVQDTLNICARNRPIEAEFRSSTGPLEAAGNRLLCCPVSSDTICQRFGVRQTGERKSREQTVIRLVAALIALLSLVPAASAQDKPPAKAVLLLNWYVYSEHAPFFLGLERGYFAEEGIDLQIQEGRGSVPTVQAVAGGSADFGYADVASMIKAAAQGAPVVTTGVLLQKSPMALIGLAERNIHSPADMRGKTVALTPGDSLSLVWPLLLKKMGLKEDELTIVSGDPQTKLNAVINGRADLMLGYLNDQNLRIEKATGKPVTVIPFSDFGVNLISSCIVVNKDMLAKNPELARHFMKAAARAVQATEKDPEAAVDALLKAYPKAGERKLLLDGLKLTLPLYHTEETKSLPPFQVSPANFASSVSVLVEYAGVNKSAADHPQDFYALQYLPK
jgi:NitT/TauT family transport system substrate-binding protein